MTGVMDRKIIFRDGQNVCPLGQGTYQMGRRRSEGIQAVVRSPKPSILWWNWSRNEKSGNAA